MAASDWRNGLTVAAAAAAFVAFAFFGTTREGTGALVVLAVVVGGSGLGVLIAGLLTAKGTLRQHLQKPLAVTGLDITAAMLGAFGLATAFADPPLF